MAKNQVPVETVEGDELSPDQLREELKKARGRIAAMEAVGKTTRGGLTHPHDIERLYRLGLLPPEDVARFQATGQLPGGGGPDDLNLVKVEPKV
jgi:hypothetical protein